MDKTVHKAKVLIAQVFSLTIKKLSKSEISNSHEKFSSSLQSIEHLSVERCKRIESRKGKFLSLNFPACVGYRVGFVRIN